MEKTKTHNKIVETPKVEDIVNNKNPKEYTDINDNLLEIYELISKQNNRLNQVIDSISSIKSQLNDYDSIQNELKEQYEQNKEIEEEINRKILPM